MADENYNPDEGMEGENASNAATEQQNELVSAMNALNEEAQDLGFSNYQEYKGFLEEKANEAFQADEAKKKIQPKIQKQSAPTIPVEQPNYDERFEKSEQASRTAYLEAQYVQYRQDQLELPKEDRISLTKKELMDTIQNRPDAVMIKELMADPQYNQNIFAATAALKTMRGAISAQKKQAIANAAAIRSEKETANMSTGQAPPPPPTEKSENDILADQIAQDDVYIYPV